MYSDDFYHLPDPERQAEFYDGVTVKRGIAWVIDTVLVALITLPVALFSIVGLFFIPFLFFVISFLYRWITIAGGSATPGMRAMAIELRNVDGRRLDSTQALLHTLGFTLSMMVFIVQIVSIGLMFTSSRGQGLSDMVLGTVALNRRV
ncbi:MAG: RDD family protein [Pelagimonas sp.]|jgi:uncharacterized RDD family membrane protein YckC|nr:RDD family protein [Pelagimonas sp.]